LKTILIFFAAAFFEIAGCFAFWSWQRMGASPWWTVPGAISLIAFGYLLTLADSDYAGRAYAAYGGVYIVASITWLMLVERARPDVWDLAGSGLCVAGTLVILLAPR